MTAHNQHYRKLYARVDRSGGPDACWPWTGPRNGTGYGRVWQDGAYRYAHRVAYEEAYGAIPDGLDICHTCDNPPCCNPAHLWAGTARENLRDAASKGRLRGWADGRNGEAVHNHKLTWDAVRAIRARQAAGESQHALAREYGVTQVNIHFIVTGKTWQLTNTPRSRAYCPVAS